MKPQSRKARRLGGTKLRNIAEREFQELERLARLRNDECGEALRDDVSLNPAETETDDFIACLAYEMGDALHSDQVGVSRRKEPKSIHSKVPPSQMGSFMKPKLSSKPKGNDGHVKLWQGNLAGKLDPYMHRHYGGGWVPPKRSR